jgi:orotate phosphoribosyltransferase-like protein
MSRTPTIPDILIAVERVTHVGAREIRSAAIALHIRESRMLAIFVASQCFNIGATEIANGLNLNWRTVTRAIAHLKSATRINPDLVDKVEDEVESILATKRHSLPESIVQSLTMEGC